MANKSAVLVTGSGAEGALRSGGVTLWHVTWAAASAVALGTAEVTGQSLHSHCLLIRLAASAWVAVVGGVGRDLLRFRRVETTTIGIDGWGRFRCSS